MEKGSIMIIKSHNDTILFLKLHWREHKLFALKNMMGFECYTPLL